MSPSNDGDIWSGQLLVLALLISNAAAGLASGLAGSLALAAAAVLGAVAQVLGLQSLNALHKESPSYLFDFIHYSTVKKKIID